MDVNWCAYRKSTANEALSLVANDNAYSAFNVAPYQRNGHGGCAAYECRFGSPFLIAKNISFSIPSSELIVINIFPVKKVDVVTFHGTRQECVDGIYRYGLLPKTDRRIDRYGGHGNPDTEGWMRFTGSMKAAISHDQGAIIPIRYSGYILESCMGLQPEPLFRLFGLIPEIIQCVRMDEDGESYVFRESANLFPPSMEIDELIQCGWGRNKLSELLNRIAFDVSTYINSGEIIDVPVASILSHVWVENRYKEAVELLAAGEMPEPVSLTEYEINGQLFYGVGDGNHRVESFRDAGREHIKARIVRRAKCNLSDIEILDRDDGMFLYLISSKLGIQLERNSLDLDFYKSLGIKIIKQDLRNWLQRLFGLKYKKRKL